MCSETGYVNWPFFKSEKSAKSLKKRDIQNGTLVRKRLLPFDTKSIIKCEENAPNGIFFMQSSAKFDTLLLLQYLGWYNFI